MSQKIARARSRFPSSKEHQNRGRAPIKPDGTVAKRERIVEGAASGIVARKRGGEISGEADSGR